MKGAWDCEKRHRIQDVSHVTNDTKEDYYSLHTRALVLYMRIGIPVSESQCTKICKAHQRTASTRNRARRVSTVLAHAHAIVHGPPDDFEPRKKLRPPSERFIKDHYAQLSDLAEKGELFIRLALASKVNSHTRRIPNHSANAGILTVVQRPADYRERRDDGYKVTGSAAERVSSCYATQALSKAPVLIIAICQLNTRSAHYFINSRCPGARVHIRCGDRPLLRAVCRGC